jgi:hypothetical protein
MAKLLALLPQPAAAADADAAPARSVETVTKATFALGHLLRGNRRSQRIFSENGGSALFRDGLVLGNMTTGGLTAGPASVDGRKSIGLLSKVLALVADLLCVQLTCPDAQ